MWVDNNMSDILKLVYMEKETCNLCRRRLPERYMTTHHLTPKERSKSDTIEICQPCHKQLHVLFTNHELKHDYNSAESLREADNMASFVSWIRGTDKVDIRVDESDSVRDWRE